jgi:murein endopeptidase
MPARLLFAALLALAVPAGVVFALAAQDREPLRPPEPRADVPPAAAVATPAPTAAPTATPPGRRERSASRGARPAGPSRALGLPFRGRLVNGRLLPESGAGYATWDPILKRLPNREWRRYGTERLLATVQAVLAEYARTRPDAPPVLVGDLSRPRGGDFGPRFGGIGHASHQNGLDADVYYPRLDGRLRPPRRPRQVDLAAAQALVDAFVATGARYVFVGPSLDLRGPRGVVQALTHHDNHLHVRIRE